MTERPKLYPGHQHEWADADPVETTAGPSEQTWLQEEFTRATARRAALPRWALPARVITRPGYMPRSQPIPESNGRTDEPRR